MGCSHWARQLAAATLCSALVPSCRPDPCSPPWSACTGFHRGTCRSIAATIARACIAPACPPVSWDDTGASARPRIPLLPVCCWRMHVRCPHLRSSFLGSLLLISPTTISTTVCRMRQPMPPHDGETLHATWANAGVTTRRFEARSSPSQVWAIHLWTECVCKIGRSGFQLPRASALTAPPGQTKEITIRDG